MVKISPHLKRFPLIVWGLIIIFLISLSLIFLAKTQNQKSKLTLESSLNKFRLNFEINKKDQQIFSEILANLKIPRSVQEEVEFELDATSSASLAFATPIEATLDIEPLTVKFQGTTTPLSPKESNMESFRLPSSTNLAVFAPSFKDFFKIKFKLPAEFSKWLENNLKTPGQYLVIFGQDANVAIIFKSQRLDIDGLKNLQIDQEEPLYKEETKDGINFHILSLKEIARGKQITPTLFSIGNWVFMTSSYEAAQQMIAAQKAYPKGAYKFSTQEKPPISLALIFRNPQDYPIGEEFNKFLFPNAQSITSTLEKIDKIEFTLKANRFSGLINIK